MMVLDTPSGRSYSVAAAPGAPLLSGAPPFNIRERKDPVKKIRRLVAGLLLAVTVGAEAQKDLCLGCFEYSIYVYNTCMQGGNSDGACNGLQNSIISLCNERYGCGYNPL